MNKTPFDEILEKELASGEYNDEQKRKLVEQTEYIKKAYQKDLEYQAKERAEKEAQAKEQELKRLEDQAKRAAIPIKLDADGVPIFDTDKFLTHQEYLDALTEAQREIYEKRKKLEDEQNELEEKKRQFEQKNFQIQRIIHDAGIPLKYRSKTIADFLTTNKNERQAIELLQAIQNDKSYYIHGDNGTGKTLICSIILNERAKKLKTSVFMRSVKIFSSLNPFYNHSDTITERKSLYEHTPCLIIDDLGAEKPSEFTKQALFEIIDSRYNNELQTIITSNFDLKQLIKRIGQYEGKRIARRIMEMCNVIELKHYKESVFKDLDLEDE